MAGFKLTNFKPMQEDNRRLRAENEELRRDRDVLQTRVDALTDNRDLAIERVVELQARVADLEAALRPFAYEADYHEPGPGVIINDNVQLWQRQRGRLTIGDLRRAARTLGDHDG